MRQAEKNTGFGKYLEGDREGRFDYINDVYFEIYLTE